MDQPLFESKEEAQAEADRLNEALHLPDEDEVSYDAIYRAEPHGEQYIVAGFGCWRSWFNGSMHGDGVTLWPAMSALEVRHTLRQGYDQEKQRQGVAGRALSRDAGTA